jgi:uncharacterized protein YqeY
MSLEQRLSDDLKTAMRDRDELRLSVVRMLRSAVLLEKKKPHAPETIPDETVLRLIQGHVKKVKEALEHAVKAGRDDLAAAARRELTVAEGYLPAALTDTELAEIARAAAAESGASGPAGLGAAMKAAMARVQGRADGKRVQEAVRRALGGDA